MVGAFEALGGSQGRKPVHDGCESGKRRDACSSPWVHRFIVAPKLALEATAVVANLRSEILLFQRLGALVSMVTVDRSRIKALLEREFFEFERENPTSRRIHQQATHLVGGVPMTWMSKWSGGFPLAFREAHGNRIIDVDGRSRIDFALGDTGAMAGHSPRATVEAVNRRIGELGGITTMLPTEDAEWVAEELTKRFGLGHWSFTLSATDANRWALRLARLVTGRSKILVFSYCYHGSVDETFVVLDEDGMAVSRPGNVAPAVNPTQTTRVVEFNDLESLERELSYGDVACVLAEPALTNIGIVLPEPGFHEALRALTRRYGSLLMIDETHSFSAGWGGATSAWNLEPDILTIGKSIGGGVPCGAYGLSDAVRSQLTEALKEGADIIDVGGVGGTLAGSALSMSAMRATLGDVLTPEAFAHMIALATLFSDGVNEALTKSGLPWSVSQLGARAEYRFASPAPKTGGASAHAADEDLDTLVHLYMANRGVLITPFHNMALMCPDTSRRDVERHSELFASLCTEIVG
jgi:glutamate-1-semialdehyde 2,1-aminomutase